MDDEIEFIYNTRLRSGTLSANFQSRLSAALRRDFVREAEEDEEFNIFDEGDESTDYVPADDASDISDEVEIEANEISDSDEEEEGETGESEAHENDQGFMYAKDGTKWNKTEPSAGRFRQHNIMRFQSGPKTKLNNPTEVFKLFFSQNITYIIITETNRNGQAAVTKWNEQHPDLTPKKWVDLTSVELDAFIGILLASGLSHNNMQNSSLLWRSDALPIFRAAMSHKRFIALSRLIDYSMK